MTMLGCRAAARASGRAVPRDRHDGRFVGRARRARDGAGRGLRAAGVLRGDRHARSQAERRDPAPRREAGRAPRRVRRAADAQRRSTAEPWLRRRLLGLSLVSMWGVRRLARYMEKRLPEAGVLHHLPAFLEHANVCAELRLRRIGVLDRPLAELSVGKRALLVVEAYGGKLLGGLGSLLATPLKLLPWFRKKRVTDTYLADHAHHRLSAAGARRYRADATPKSSVARRGYFDRRIDRHAARSVVARDLQRIERDERGAEHALREIVVADWLRHVPRRDHPATSLVGRAVDGADRRTFLAVCRQLARRPFSRTRMCRAAARGRLLCLADWRERADEVADPVRDCRRVGIEPTTPMRRSSGSSLPSTSCGASDPRSRATRRRDPARSGLWAPVARRCPRAQPTDRARHARQSIALAVEQRHQRTRQVVGECARGHDGVHARADELGRRVRHVAERHVLEYDDPAIAVVRVQRGDPQRDHRGATTVVIRHDSSSDIHAAGTSLRLPARWISRCLLRMSVWSRSMSSGQRPGARTLPLRS